MGSYVYVFLCILVYSIVSVHAYAFLCVPTLSCVPLSSMFSYDSRTSMLVIKLVKNEGSYDGHKIQAHLRGPGPLALGARPWALGRQSRCPGPGAGPRARAQGPGPRAPPGLEMHSKDLGWGRTLPPLREG